MRKILAILALGALMLMLPAGGKAFQLANYNGPQWYAGLHWGPLPVPYADRAGMIWCFDAQDDVPVYGGEAAIQLAVDNWNTYVNPDFGFEQTAACPKPGGQSAAYNDGINEIGFYNGFDGFGGHTYPLFDGQTGLLREADIWIWYDASGLNPVEGLALHELGHALGLSTCSTHPGSLTCNEVDDPSVGVADPCAPAGYGNSVFCYEVGRTSITVDDQMGARFIYEDQDGDGCTGLQEYSALKAKGGGTVLNHHRYDEIGGRTWYLGRKIDFGDVDGDHLTSILDLSKINSKFQQTVVSLGGTAPDRYDQDGDGTISILDTSRAAASFTDTCAGDGWW